MRKIALVGIAAATALGVAWSASMLPGQVGKANALAASAPIVPHEMMVRLGKSIPAQYWSHPF
jgi:hypothetical protein